MTTDQKTHQHARRGGGTRVHAIGPDGQLCGAGKGQRAPLTGGQHRMSRLHLTNQAITCKACLKALEKAKHNERNPTMHHYDNEPVDDDTDDVNWHE